MSKNFKDFVDNDKIVGFYGVDCNRFKIGRTIFEAIEDESDDYRSYLETIEVIEDKSIFFHKKVASVYVRTLSDNNFEGYKLVDKNGHIWLTVGTENSDEYYPCFIFMYNPLIRYQIVG